MSHVLTTSKVASAASAEAFLATIDLSALRNRKEIFQADNRFADMALDRASAISADVLIEGSTQSVLAGAGEKTSTISISGVGAGSPPSGATQSPIGSAAGAIKLATDTQQAFVVGSNVISFNAGVTDDRRRAALNSALLAQLTAEEKYPNRITPENVAGWAEIYYDTLYNIGWVQQGDSSGSQRFVGKTATVQAAILSFASTLFGTSGAALVKAALDGFAKLGSTDQTFKVFKQQSQSAKAANFTVGLASGDPASGFALDLVDYSVAANQVETQVIVFDWSTSNATLNYEKRTFSLNDAVYAAVADQIARKIADFQQSYLKLIHISPTA